MQKVETTKGLIAAYAFVFLFILGCSEQPAKQVSDQANQNAIFPKGELAPAENFTGKAWHKPLITSDTIYNTIVGNVYFEPGARTNWHSHPSGQILVITDGVGYHQVKGQPRQTIKKGDVVTCPPDVMHWHGASAEVGLQQIYIVPKTEKGIVKWMNPVTEDEYSKTE